MCTCVMCRRSHPSWYPNELKQHIEHTRELTRITTQRAAIIQERLKIVEQYQELSYPPPSWIPDDAPAKKKYTRPTPPPPDLRLLVEWVELKREVALVCRLWWAWLGGSWHSN